MEIERDGVLYVCPRSFGERFAVDELRWHTSVRPGDVLSLRTEITEKHPVENPCVGHVNAKLTGVNQRDETVISWTLLGLIERRERDGFVADEDSDSTPTANRVGRIASIRTRFEGPILLDSRVRL